MWNPFRSKLGAAVLGGEFFVRCVCVFLFHRESRSFTIGNQGSKIEPSVAMLSSFGDIPKILSFWVQLVRSCANGLLVEPASYLARVRRAYPHHTALHI